MMNRLIVLAGTLGLALVLLLSSSSASSLAVVDPERNSSQETGWYWYHDVAPSFLSDQISSKGLRLIDLAANSPSTFTAVLVRNSGTFARTWWWYYGLTADDLSGKISLQNARITDIEPYLSSGQLRFAATLVKNTGDSAKAWWWYYGLSFNEIAPKLSQNGARLVDIDAYELGGSTRYAVVMVKNTGVDATAWWWYAKVSPEAIADKLKANDARVIGLEPDGSGLFDVIMVKKAGEYWWWYYGIDADQVGSLIGQNGSRLIDLEPYTSGGKRSYAVAMINNLDAESTRIRQFLAPGWTGGSFGFYLKKVGGNVVAHLNESTVFEPASSLKALHAAYTLRRVQDGADMLGSNINYYVKPDDTANKDVCPDPAWEGNSQLKRTTTLRDAIKKMLRVSDNRTTRAISLRATQDALNTYARNTVGMANTQLRQIFGCGLKNGLKNDLTLVDAGKLYEGLDNGTLLNSTYKGYLLDGSDVSPADPLMYKGVGSYGNIVQQEAAALGKTAIVAQFTSGVVQHSKGGSYGFGVSSAAYRTILTDAGIITIPFKSGGAIVPTDFVFGRWVDVQINCAGKGASETQAAFKARCPQAKGVSDTVTAATGELIRAQIRAALQTW